MTCPHINYEVLVEGEFWICLEQIWQIPLPGWGMIKCSAAAKKRVIQ